MRGVEIVREILFGSVDAAWLYLFLGNADAEDQVKQRARKRAREKRHGCIEEPYDVGRNVESLRDPATHTGDPAILPRAAQSRAGSQCSLLRRWQVQRRPFPWDAGAGIAPARGIRECGSLREDPRRAGTVLHPAARMLRQLSSVLLPLVRSGMARGRPSDEIE